MYNVTLRLFCQPTNDVTSMCAGAGPHGCKAAMQPASHAAQHAARDSSSSCSLCSADTWTAAARSLGQRHEQPCNIKDQLPRQHQHMHQTMRRAYECLKCTGRWASGQMIAEATLAAATTCWHLHEKARVLSNRQPGILVCYRLRQDVACTTKRSMAESWS